MRKRLYSITDTVQFFEYVQTLDSSATTSTEYFKRHLIVLPTQNIFITTTKQRDPVIIINRAPVQSYFIKNLHERYHCDVGENGLQFFLKVLSNNNIPSLLVKNTTEFVKSEDLQLLVINKVNKSSQNNILIKKN